MNSNISILLDSKILIILESRCVFELIIFHTVIELYSSQMAYKICSIMDITFVIIKQIK